MREQFEHAARAIVPFAAVERLAGVKLGIEKRDEAFHDSAVFSKVFVQRGCKRKFGILFWHGADVDAVCTKLVAFVRSGPIRIVCVESAGEGRHQKRVGAVDIVLLAGQLDRAHQHSTGCEHEMFAHAVKILVQGRTVAVLGQAVQAYFVARSHGAADMDRMRVDDAKGGRLSPVI